MHMHGNENSEATRLSYLIDLPLGPVVSEVHGQREQVKMREMQKRACCHRRPSSHRRLSSPHPLAMAMVRETVEGTVGRVVDVKIAVREAEEEDQEAGEERGWVVEAAMVMAVVDKSIVQRRAAAHGPAPKAAHPRACPRPLARSARAARWSPCHWNSVCSTVTARSSSSARQNLSFAAQIMYERGAPFKG